MSDDDLTIESDNDDDLVKKLRSALKDSSKGRKALEREAEEAKAELAALRREKLFTEAEIPEGARGLLAKALADEEDLSVDKIRQVATEAGLVQPPKPPAPEAGPGEIEGHQAINHAMNLEGSTQASVEDLFANAQSQAEVIRIAAESGLPLKMQ